MAIANTRSSPAGRWTGRQAIQSSHMGQSVMIWHVYYWPVTATAHFVLATFDLLLLGSKEHFNQCDPKCISIKCHYGAFRLHRQCKGDKRDLVSLQSSTLTDHISITRWRQCPGRNEEIRSLNGINTARVRALIPSRGQSTHAEKSMCSQYCRTVCITASDHHEMWYIH